MRRLFTVRLYSNKINVDRKADIILSWKNLMINVDSDLIADSCFCKSEYRIFWEILRKLFFSPQKSEM